MKRSIQKGFTLIELMIVVAIIGILAAVAIPQYQDYVTRAKLAKVAVAIDPVKTAVAMYAQENNGLPAAATTLTWAQLGLPASGPAATTEVSAFANAGGGAVTATLRNIGAPFDGTAVTFTPTVNATSLSWAVTCATTITGNSKAVATKTLGCP